MMPGANKAYGIVEKRDFEKKKRYCLDRIGYAIVDSANAEKVSFWFTHK
jgi:hypothetical protein